MSGEATWSGTGPAGPGGGRRRTSGAVVVGVLALDSLVLGMFTPLSLLYLVAVSGQSLARVGVVLTVAGALALPVPLWVGRLVDSHGARPLVIVAQVVQALGFAGYLVTGDLALVFAAALVVSVGQRTYWASAFALVGEITASDTRPRARERWFSLIAALRAAGYSIGAAVAGVAVATDPEAVGRVVVAVAAGLLIVAAVAIATLVGGRRPAEVHPEGPVRAVGASRVGYAALWRDRGYLALAAVNVLYALCNAMLGIALAPTIERALPALVFLVGPLLVGNAVVQALLQIPVAARVRRLDRVRALALAGALWAMWALLVVTALHTPRTVAVLALVIGVACYSFAQLVHGPLANAVSVEAAPALVRGRYLAVFGYSTALATVAAPGVFAVLFTAADELPWLLVIAAGAATAPLIATVARRVPVLRAAPTRT